jgi:hypothetical protein
MIARSALRNYMVWLAAAYSEIIWYCSFAESQGQPWPPRSCGLACSHPHAVRTPVETFSHPIPPRQKSDLLKHTDSQGRKGFGLAAAAEALIHSQGQARQLAFDDGQAEEGEGRDRGWEEDLIHRHLQCDVEGEGRRQRARGRQVSGGESRRRGNASGAAASCGPWRRHAWPWDSASPHTPVRERLCCEAGTAQRRGLRPGDCDRLAACLYMQ